MTTRHDLFIRVRKAIDEVDRVNTGERIDEIAWAAIEAVISTIGDHALAKMIGDTGKRSDVDRVVTHQGTVVDEIEVLQDDDDSDEP